MDDPDAPDPGPGGDPVPVCGGEADEAGLLFAVSTDGPDEGDRAEA